MIHPVDDPVTIQGVSLRSSTGSWLTFYRYDTAGGIVKLSSAIPAIYGHMEIAGITVQDDDRKCGIGHVALSRFILHHPARAPRAFPVWRGELAGCELARTASVERRADRVARTRLALAGRLLRAAWRVCAPQAPDAPGGARRSGRDTWRTRAARRSTYGPAHLAGS